MTPLHRLQRAIEDAFVASWDVRPDDMGDELTHLVFLMGQQIGWDRLGDLIDTLIDDGGDE
jgi:hypothetical protein